MSEAALRQRLLDYLRSHNVAVLATAGDGGPWATPVFFASQEFTLYFVSDPKTRHGTDIGAGARVAAAITEDHRDWQSIQGIQLEGLCAPVPPEQRGEAAALFMAKYTFTSAFLDPGGSMYERAGRNVIFYRLVPDAVWFTDNTRGFGQREHLDLQS